MELGFRCFWQTRKKMSSSSLVCMCGPGVGNRRPLVFIILWKSGLADWFILILWMTKLWNLSFVPSDKHERCPIPSSPTKTTNASSKSQLIDRSSCVVTKNQCTITVVDSLWIAHRHKLSRNNFVYTDAVLLVVRHNTVKVGVACTNSICGPSHTNGVENRRPPVCF